MLHCAAMPDVEPDASSQSCPACGLLIDVSREEPLAKVACPECGEKFRVERAFDNFALLETLGIGGMGSVYKARDTRLNRFVALKLLRPELSADPAEIQRLEHEARATAAVVKDVVIVGSYVPDGIAVGEWVCTTARGVTAFYDIDTPVTLAAIEAGDCTYLSPAVIRRYDLYLSFTGGPTLARLEREYGARRARALYCSFDPALYHPDRREPEFDLGYMGTFSRDRQPSLDRLMLGALGVGESIDDGRELDLIDGPYVDRTGVGHGVDPPYSGERWKTGRRDFVRPATGDRDCGKE